MKTISELEAELEELKTETAEAWAKVQQAREVYDKLTGPWVTLHQRTKRLSETLQIRKEMEAAQ